LIIRKNMFIELTEIVIRDRLSTHISKPKERAVSVNPSKIQCFWADSIGNTVLQMRRDQIKVKETYEEVKDAIQKN